MRDYRTTAVIIALLFVLASTAVGDDDSLSFNNDVRPILSDNCFHCHGPAEESRESGLRLDVREDAVEYGAVVPENPDESLLIERIYSTDPELRMPPPISKRNLTEEEKETLRRWIANGADYQKHWSLHPLPERVEAPLQDARWPRSDLDRFVLRKLKAAGLTPNVEADREAWIRRVTFDLTGLPPTLKELDNFLNDGSDQAYERVVDRLLATPAHAERMASEWLDVARYSDTYGFQRDDERFVWPWRDWVVQSFLRNQPYDEFVTWQLAGDLLPQATREQKLATAFCRLHSHKKEGGVAVEEFRVENVADRTHTFAGAMLGLTMECARCHDHKYDSISTKEYYELTSFFANVDERGLISYFTDATPTPAMPLPSAEQEEKLAATRIRIDQASRVLAEELDSVGLRFEQWLKTSPKATPETSGLVSRITFDRSKSDPPEDLLFDEDTGFVEVNKKSIDASKVLAFSNEVDPDSPATTNRQNRVVPGREGQAILLTGDDSVVIPKVGHIERHDPISISLWIKPSEVDERCVVFRRSGGWDDSGSMGYALIKRGAKLRANLVHFWPGNAICVETDEVLRAGEWRHVAVTYDGSSRASGLRIYLDGEDTKARIVQDHLTRTISKWRGGYTDLAIGSRYRDRGFKDGAVDDFRVYDRELTPLEVRHDFDGESLDAALAANASGELTEGQKASLRQYYVSVVDGPTRSAREQLRRGRGERNGLIDSIPAITVMREQATPRPAYVLERGSYEAHGERVTADTPAALPPFPKDQPRNRLGLARWLFLPDHPLTARVAVNRYWQMLFGEGLVRTSEDFGSQGSPPTHPALLDWLARDFVDHGWDTRRLLRMMTLSATYRQSSVVDVDVRARDPENRLLSRGPSKKLSAEMVRDNALAVSGLLVDRLGGPPVKPYDLPLAYTPVDADKDEGLYRRSLYTFWKRTSPSPVMMTMNANRREVCQLRREVTSSPLQALVLLNGTQFMEASRVLAEDLLRRYGADLDKLLEEAFRKLISRRPSPHEVQILRDAYDEQLAEFRSRPELAEELIHTGNAPLGDDVSKVDLAAATVVVNSLMNLDECVRCR